MVSALQYKGTYTLKYEDADGNLSEVGTIENGDKNWLDEVGYQKDKRYSASSGSETTHDGCYLTGYIPVTANQIVHIINMTMDKNIGDGNKCFGYLFDTDKANAKKIQVGTGGAYTFDGLGAVWDSNGYLTQFTVPADGFIRLQASYIGADSVITLE